MLFRTKKEIYENEYDNTHMSSDIKDVKGSVIMIVESLLNNISFYTGRIEELERENNQLKQFIHELAEIVSSDRKDILVQMEAYLSSKILQK